MSVCFVVERIGKPSETFIRRDLVELARQDEEFVVYALHRPRPGDVDTPEELDGRLHFAPGIISLGSFFSKLRWVLFHPLRVLGGVGLLPSALARPVSGLRELLAARRAYRLASLVRRHRAERIHCEFATSPATVGWVASRLARVPYSVSVHAWDIYVYRTMLKAKLRAADRVVACSEGAAEYVVDYLGVPEEKALVVHHGLPLDEFPYLADRPPLPPLRVLAIGRLVVKKGFTYLIEALALLRKRGIPAECVIVGDGPLEAKLAKRAATLGISDEVAFTGTLPGDEVSGALGEAHVLAAPSVEPRSGDRDGIPNVVLEAMARGTPVVATDAGGLGEVVRDGDTGLVAAQGDAAELAAAIRRAAEEPGLCARLTANARRLVESEFDVRRNAPRLLDALSGELPRDQTA